MDEVEKRLEKRLDAQSSDLKEHMSLIIEPIRIQTTKTNGRVTFLEEQLSSHRAWRTGMTWGGSVLFFFLTTFILPVLTWNLLQTLDLRENLSNEMQAAVGLSLEEHYGEMK